MQWNAMQWRWWWWLALSASASPCFALLPDAHDEKLFPCVYPLTHSLSHEWMYVCTLWPSKIFIQCTRKYFLTASYFLIMRTTRIQSRPALSAVREWNPWHTSHAYENSKCGNEWMNETQRERYESWLQFLPVKEKRRWILIDRLDSLQIIWHAPHSTHVSLIQYPTYANVSVCVILSVIAELMTALFIAWSEYFFVPIHLMCFFFQNEIQKRRKRTESHIVNRL